MARLVNRSSNHLEIRKIWKGTLQGTAGLSPGESMNWGAGPDTAVKYWIRGNTSTSKTIETPDHNATYELF